MNENFFKAMRLATASTNAFDLLGATRIIQDALADREPRRSGVEQEENIASPKARQSRRPFAIDPDAEVIEVAIEDVPRPAATQRDHGAAARTRRPLEEVLRILRDGRLAAGISTSKSLGREASAPPIVPGSQFVRRSFTCAAGTRSYKLYVPAAQSARPQGVIVMLHGCKQDPDDFAVGTGMNAVAEEHGLLVAYPHQTGANNASSCWNWFNPGDQTRGTGEPAIIAGITSEIMSEFDVAPNRVFVAGLSAGGAMAAVMGETYPDLYAAVGIHSGLAYRSANDVVSAFAAMRGDGGSPQRSVTRGTPQKTRTIVFQGAADRTVHPSNADRIVASVGRVVEGPQSRRNTGLSAGGLRYAWTQVTNHEELPLLEHWMVEGAGHAWLGGDAAGSYTDPRGPSATREMIRFFLAERSVS